ncbi:hypothetical protein BIW11_02251 [Tropilaelaps mercedesae]|uniref:Uncharacterized protein n=1 Tax=Tropilaelaps mercedesae TaxID=418985 RepID=A0A1V9X181_9ACAR|nr:hypothetical protein BIW11_02251 [Tropilaelaps mercedesae]
MNVSTASNPTRLTRCVTPDLTIGCKAMAFGALRVELHLKSSSECNPSDSSEVARGSNPGRSLAMTVPTFPLAPPPRVFLPSSAQATTASRVSI